METRFRPAPYSLRLLVQSTYVLAAVIAIAMGTLVGMHDVSAQTSVALDPSGDAKLNAPGFQDLVRAEVTKDGSDFVLQMQVDAAIPASLPLPLPSQFEIWWFWGFHLDPGFPTGYPFPPGEPLPLEVVVYVGWNGNSFSGFAIDRRPADESIITPVPFSVEGATLRVVLPSAVIGNPSNFTWGSGTIDWSGPVGSQGLHFIDVRPGNSWPAAGATEPFAADQLRTGTFPARELELDQNVPNPFNPSTTISFQLPENAMVQLDVFDVSGRHIRALANGGFGAGPHAIGWDGTDASGTRVSSGVYIYRLAVGQQSFSRRMVLLK